MASGGRFLPDALGDPSRSKNAVCKAAAIKYEAEANAFIALAQAEEATIQADEAIIAACRAHKPC